MTNRGKYEKEIMDIACSGNRLAVDKKTMKPTKCKKLTCEECCFYSNCSTKCEEWCNAEYHEPPIDWNKVPVDTPILVRDHENAVWRKGHFAKYENNKIYAWFGGKTSWSTTAMIEWNYAKLAEGGE